MFRNAFQLPSGGFRWLRSAQLLIGLIALGLIATLTPQLASAAPVGPPTHLLAVGPTSVDNGFPVWYKDSNNLSVGTCLDITNPFCNLGAAGVPDPILPPEEFDNTGEIPTYAPDTTAHQGSQF